jgi:lipid II:glycine glycyltransferase (peptidoglycan interpeptide bridge formation enzyme)
MDRNNQNINFLQSKQWRKFQESAGHRTFFVESEGFSASVIEHNLPIVGKYFYCPRGPVIKSQISNLKSKINSLIDLAKKENVGWIRIDPENEDTLNSIKKSIDYKIEKAPHDMQPKEIFVLDIIKPEEQLLAEMKSKTRYNIKLAQKSGVAIRITNNIEEFLKLTKEMATRQGIGTHPDGYYRKMFENLPENMLKLYVAEYEGKIIAANLMLYFGDTATYLHGASSNENRNVMAPYLLQWQAILDAKKAGYKFYDFGGIKTLNIQTSNDWAGITKFKLGFSPNTQPLEFPGSYDIVINNGKYLGYKLFSLFFGFYRKIIK